MIGNVASTSFQSWAQTQSMGAPPPKPDPAKLFAAIDADSNGEVSTSELTDILGSNRSEDVSALLSSLDADGNGTVSQNEFTSSVESVLTQLRDQAGAFGMPPPPPPEDAFTTLDANGDGSVSQTELSDAFSARAEASGMQGPSAEDFMARFDTNGDGTLSESELIDAQQPPPAPPPDAQTDESAMDQQFIATVLNQYLSNSSLFDGSSTFVASA